MNSSEACLYSRRRECQSKSVKYYMPDFGIGSNDKVLDIGCGTGELVNEIGTVARYVVGIDISKDMIDTAKQKKQRDNVTYIIADAVSFIDHFPEWKESFDKVVSVHVLHWVEDKLGAIQNIYDCLKFNGECFLLFCGPMHQLLGQNSDELPYYLKNHIKWKEHLKDYIHGMYNELNKDDAITLFKSIGFEIIEEKSHAPCEVIDISSETELKENLRTLLGHFRHIPRKHHAEFLQDAADWCQHNFPVNQSGHIYARVEIIVIHARKKENI